ATAPPIPVARRKGRRVPDRLLSDIRPIKATRGLVRPRPGLYKTRFLGVNGGRMEEVIEQLRELNEPVPVPLELPDDERLVEVEEELFINLPYGLREFLLLVSDVVYGRLEPVTATDPQSHTYLPEVAALAWDAGVE